LHHVSWYYRRYPRRDDLVEALVRRETQRFLGAVADAIDAAEDPHDAERRRFARDVLTPMVERAVG
jgi:TetR/AcrR family transcriptional regulator, repressor for uid operon